MPNGYFGTHMYNCHAQMYDWDSTWAEIVSGDGVNVCGHTLLWVGNDRFHVDGPNDRPWYLSHAGYMRYMKENKKKRLRVDRVRITNPQGAQAKLEELSARKWIWGLFAHNCATFVEEIVQAGGAKNVGLWTNCPAKETFR